MRRRRFNSKPLIGKTIASVEVTETSSADPDTSNKKIIIYFTDGSCIRPYVAGETPYGYDITIEYRSAPKKKSPSAP
jgi:hypothetical protein